MFLGCVTNNHEYYQQIIFSQIITLIRQFEGVESKIQNLPKQNDREAD